MKTKFYVVASLLAITLSMVACSRGGDDTAVAAGGTAGVSSDGKSVTVSGKIEEKDLSLVIKEFTRNCSSYSSYSSYCMISFQVSINGSVPLYGNFSAMGTYPTMQQSVVREGFLMKGQVACYDSKCDNTLVVLTATPEQNTYSYDPATEYKLVAIKYDMVNNKVANVKEYVARSGSLPSAQALLSEL